MTEAWAPGMRERELREAATCGLCGEKIGKSRLPLFWRVRIERWGIKHDAVMRQTGLAMVLGGNGVLASVMGPDEEMAVPVMEPITLTVCETCAVEKALPVAGIADRVRVEPEAVEP